VVGFLEAEGAKRKRILTARKFTKVYNRECIIREYYSKKYGEPVFVVGSRRGRNISRRFGK
jgi:hypothetical protein